MSIINEIKQLIKEEQKRDVLLAKPLNEDETRNIRKPSMRSQAPTRIAPISRISPQILNQKHDTDVEPNTTVDSTEDDRTDPNKPPDRLKDLRPGFNLYHGVVTEAFTQLQSMSELGDATEIVKKVTQWALLQIGQDEDTQRVFQSSNNGSPITPQMMSAIVQKSMLIILNHVAKQAQAQAADESAFDVADA